MTQFSRFFKRLAGGWGKIGIIIPIFAVFLMSQNVSAIVQDSIQTYFVDSTNNPSTSVSSGQTISVSGNSLNLRVPITWREGYDRMTVTFNYYVSKNLSGLTDYSQVCSSVVPWNVFFRTIEDRTRNSYNVTSDGFSQLYCNREIDFDISEVGTSSEIRLLAIWQAGRFSNGVYSNIPGNVSYYASSYFIVKWWNSGGSSSATTDAVNQQTQLQIQADNNISSQSSSSFGDISSPITTNLIGVLSNFVTSLSAISPSTTCDLDLPFPAFAGGNWHVNPCQLPSAAVSFINVISSVIAIFFFVPLVTLLLKMIYNEIRSFQS